MEKKVKTSKQAADKKKFVEACEYGRLGEVKEAVEKGLLNLSYSSNYPPLHAACISDSIKVASYLIENNAEVNLLSRHLDTPLMIAAGSGLSQCFDLLISKGASIDNVNTDGDNALMQALEYGSHTSALKLINLGCPTLIKNKKGIGPIDALLADVTEVVDEPYYYHRREREGQIFVALIDKVKISRSGPELIDFYKKIIDKYPQDKYLHFTQICKAHKEKLELELDLRVGLDSNKIGQILENKI